MKYIIYTILFLIIGQVCSQTNIMVGEKAPEIYITDWIANIPADRGVTDKYVVLEFWATWCGPCIVAVPHMNAIQEKFNQEDVYYISLTDESVEKVERLLKRVPFNSIVATDQTRKTQINYGDGIKGLTYYPLTVLIDKEGAVKWIGEPKQLTDDIMSKFLGVGDLADSQNQEDPLDFMILIKDKEITYYFKLAESQGTESLKQAMGNSIFSFQSYSIKDMYADIFKARNVHIPADLSRKKFDLLYKNTDKEQSLAKLEEVLLDELGLEKQTEIITSEIYVVAIKDKSLLEETLEEKYSSKSFADDKILFTAYTIANMLEELSKISKKPFIFEQSDTLKYDFIIHITSDADIIDSLKSYGLEITDGKADIEYIQLKKR